MSLRAALTVACLMAGLAVPLTTSAGPAGAHPGPGRAAAPSPRHQPATPPPAPARSAAQAPFDLGSQPTARSRSTPAAGPQPTVPPTAPAAAASPSGGAAVLPIRATFFYPWYPESWYPTSHFTPTLGAPYDSSAPGVLAYQVAAMEYAHIEVAIASWWGPGTLTDARIPLLLDAAAGTSLRWTLYYEPAPGTQSADLAYIYSHYASSPEYEHLDGKPVLFVYSRSVASCADAASWVNLNAGRFYLDLQVFGGYQSCAIQPDQWHQYAPAERQDLQAGHSFSVSPGFWLYSSATPLLARDPGAFTQAVQEMVASAEPWQLITTWNEWGEGTAVEDAVQWESADPYGQYVDILHAIP